MNFFCTYIHDTKLQTGLKNEAIIIKRYKWNMCKVASKVLPSQMKFGTYIHNTKLQNQSIIIQKFTCNVCRGKSTVKNKNYFTTLNEILCADS